MSLGSTTKPGLPEVEPDGELRRADGAVEGDGPVGELGRATAEVDAERVLVEERRVRRDDRGAQEVVAERRRAADRDARSAGTTGRSRCGAASAPSISTGSSSSVGPGQDDRPVRRELPGEPQFGSNVSWSMIVWRAYSRAASSPDLRPCRRRTPGRRSCPRAAGPAGPAAARRRPWPSRRAPGRPASRRSRRGRRPGLSRTSLEAFVTVPLRRPSSSRRSAWTRGTLIGGLGPDRAQRAEPDAEVADLRRDRPGARRALRSVPSPPMKSPLIGEESSAPPGTRSWYVPRAGENTPR